MRRTSRLGRGNVIRFCPPILLRILRFLWKDAGAREKLKLYTSPDHFAQTPATATSITQYRAVSRNNAIVISKSARRPMTSTTMFETKRPSTQHQHMCLFKQNPLCGTADPGKLPSNAKFGAGASPFPKRPWWQSKPRAQYPDTGGRAGAPQRRRAHPDGGATCSHPPYINRQNIGLNGLSPTSALAIPSFRMPGTIV